MNRPDQSFDEQGQPTAATSPPDPDEHDRALGWREPGDEFREGLKTYAPTTADGRAQAVRAVLEVVLGGRTPQSMRLRAEMLRSIAETGRVESIGQLSKRLGVSRRRLEQIRKEIFEISHPRTVKTAREVSHPAHL